jgi:hypothetical protein
MPYNESQTRGLCYAVTTAQRAGVTRDLPRGPNDLQWAANSATLVYGTDDAVLIDTFTSIGLNAELVDWARSSPMRAVAITDTYGRRMHVEWPRSRARRTRPYGTCG